MLTCKKKKTPLKILAAIDRVRRLCINGNCTLEDYVVITRENKVLSSTLVSSAYVRGQLEIVGEFDKANAEILATQLNSGHLRVQLVVVK